MNLPTSTVSLYAMNAYKQLRDKATARRDRLIENAKTEYSRTIQIIAELEQRLAAKPPRKKARSTYVKLADLVYSVLPADRPFSVDDVFGAIEAADPKRNTTKASVNTNLNRMLNAGSIKRVRFSKNGQPALFALPSVEVECDKTMLEWAEEVEGWEDMKPVEIMVRMVENGFEMEVSPSEAVRSLERELSKLRR